MIPGAHPFISPLANPDTFHFFNNELPNPEQRPPDRGNGGNSHAKTGFRSGPLFPPEGERGCETHVSVQLFPLFFRCG